MALETQPRTGTPARPPRRRGRLLRGIGKTLIGLGVLLLLFVAYELWGTGLVTQRAQDGLRDDIVKNGFASRPIPGKGLGFIRISKIDLDMVFVEGTDVEALKKGPGHYKETPMPGEGGNVAIAGHRTTYLHPFGELHRLKPGDLIEVETRDGTFRYEVRWQRVVFPWQSEVIDRTRVPSLTLTTCHPKFSARQRLIIRAVQVAGPGTPRDGGAT